jgi:coenzyme F420-reducing hydrogenase delta subunit
MFNLSSAMATRFVDITKEMMKKTAELGPSPLRR